MWLWLPALALATLLSLLANLFKTSGRVAGKAFRLINDRKKLLPQDMALVFGDWKFYSSVVALLPNDLDQRELMETMGQVWKLVKDRRTRTFMTPAYRSFFLSTML